MRSAGIKKTILLVEDEVIIALAGKLLLSNHGFNVITASSGETAVELVNETPDIDLILMDIDLGIGIDGTRAATLILEKHEIPLVFLSSHTEIEVVEKTEGITSYGYIVKNSGETVLIASIKMAFKLFDAQQNIQKQRMDIEAAYEEMQVSNEELIETQNELIKREIELQESEETFRALFEKGPIGVAYHRMIYDEAGKPVDYFFIDANESYLKLTGVNPVGKLVTEAFPGIEKSPFDWIGTFGEVAKRGKEIRFQQYLEFNDKWYDCVGYQYKQDHFVAAFFDITEQKKTEEILSVREAQFAEFMLNLPAATFIKDNDGRTIFINKYLQDLLPPQDWNGKTTQELVASEVGQQMAADDIKVLETGTMKIIESMPDTLGVMHSYQTIKFPIRIQGKPLLLGGISIDISERMQAEKQIQALLEEKEIVLKEVHHRIKNNMSVITSMLSLQAGEPSDKSAQSILADAASRVRSMMLLYDRLYLSQGFNNLKLNQYFPNLVKQILEVFPNGQGTKTELRIADFTLSAKTLSSLGIIVNEMITNSMKYAFSDKTGGSIFLSAEIINNLVTIVYKDNGVGLPESVDFSNSGGFGMQLISLLVAQIGGTIRIEGSGGLKYTVEFQVPDATA